MNSFATPENAHTQRLRELLNGNKRCDKDALLKCVRDGADPNTKDDAGNSLLHHLVQAHDGMHDSAISELLIRHHADIDIKNAAGKTAFQCLVDGSYGKCERRYEHRIIKIATSIYNGRGYKLCDEENYDQAIKCYQRCIELEPDNASHYYYMGQAYFFNGNFDKSRETANQAIIVNKNYGNNYFLLGQLFYEENNYIAAIDSVDIAIKHHCNLKYAYELLGCAYFKSKKYENAVFAFTESLALEPNAVTYCNRGKSYQNLGKPEFALDDYKQAFAIDPEHSKALKAIEEILQLDVNALGRIEKTVLVDTIEILPEDQRRPFLEDCEDRETNLGARIHQPEGWLAKTFRFFGGNPENYAITRCDISKGTLKRVDESLHGDQGKEAVEMRKMKI